MKRDRNIQLSVLQRIGLENLLGEQRGKREDNRTYYNIRRKLRVTPEERKACMIPLPQGGFSFDEVAAAKIKLPSVTLTDDEVNRLIKMGDTIEMPVGIMDWFEPLLQELEQKEPVAIDEKTA